ncbi:hypothetical protein RB653_006440 [Dictyostelium firmibasis]|uniref:NAD(P)-binding domain-containing protein n=1 Tax=Dictyostelium firmibasis TaxID=79012 RepID=A0AAN7UMN5_9MYCE
MDVICMGSSGYVGKEVLKQLIKNENINKITCLVRKPLLDIEDPKINFIIHTDFLNYSEEFLKELVKSHQACIWTIGGRRSQFSTDEEYEKVSVDYTITFANGIVNAIKSTTENKPFTFIYCSGMGANEKANESIINRIEIETRIAKGKVERLLTEIQQSNTNYFNLLIFRPGGITENQSKLVQWLLSSFTVDLLLLSKVIIDKLINTQNISLVNKSTTIIYNKDIYNYKL